jgi:hypothetical protein
MLPIERKVHLRGLIPRVKCPDPSERFATVSTMSLISSEPIFRVHAELADIRHFGQTPYGDRRVIDIIGGRVDGPKLKGRILPGADWQIVCPDGTANLTARYGIETDAGARVLVKSDGLRHGPPEVLAALARGEPVEASRYYFRTVMRFEAADPAVDWLNRIIAIARGARDKNAVRLDVFEVL